MECAFAMKGYTLTLWLSWYLTNPKRSWDLFTCAIQSNNLPCLNLY
jgi:hypothetical protein